MKHIICLLLTCSTFIAAAQTSPDSVKLLQNRSYLITKKDGSKYTGILLNQSETDVMMNLPKTGITSLRKADIEKFELIPETAYTGGYDPTGFFVFGEIGGGLGTHNSFKMGVNIIDKKARVYSLIFCFSSRKDPKRPADMVRGLLDGYPQQSVSMFGLLFGKAYPLAPSVCRFILKGGITAGTSLTPTNYQHNSTWLSNGYTYGTKQEFCAGIVLNPTIELPPFCKSGFSFGLYGNINNVCQVIGLEGTMQFGKLRNKTQREKKRSIRPKKVW